MPDTGPECRIRMPDTGCRMYGNRPLFEQKVINVYCAIKMGVISSCHKVVIYSNKFQMIDLEHC